MNIGDNFTLQTVAKQLQLATWLL